MEKINFVVEDKGSRLNINYNNKIIIINEGMIYINVMGEDGEIKLIKEIRLDDYNNNGIDSNVEININLSKEDKLIVKDDLKDFEETVIDYLDLLIILNKKLYGDNYLNLIFN